MTEDPKKHSLRWWVTIVLPKIPVFLLALPIVLLMRILRPIIWIRLIPVPEPIGHTLGNVDVYLLERSVRLHPQAIDIFYPDRPGYCNKQAIKMWKRRVPLYNFVYWIAWANLEIPGNGPHHFVPPHSCRDMYGLLDDTPPPIAFSNTEEDEGANLLHAMGIPPGSRIVCFHARDKVFKNTVLPNVNTDYHNHRDAEINTYIPAIKELVARGYYCIRMGRFGREAFGWQHPQVIDYVVSPMQSDFADLYLISRCHFYIGSNCGVDAIAAIFRKSMSILNRIPMTGHWAWSRHNLDIYKKLWLIKEKRFLKFHEIINSDLGQYLLMEQYKQAGIEVVNNTPEEILDLVIEKEERIQGTWQTNDELEALQRRFWALFKPDKWNKIFRARAGSKFLLQNRELLEH